MSYNHGEFDGLESLDEIELEGKSWQFYLLRIWKGKDGYYLGTDSGCSCPTPFENYSRDSLTGPLAREQAAEESLSLAKDAGGYGITNVAAFWEDQK